VRVRSPTGTVASGLSDKAVELRVRGVGFRGFVVGSFARDLAGGR